MYIDIQKFKNGQLYSRPEWNTPTHKESIFVLTNSTFKYIASKEDGFWTVKAEAFLPPLFADDYFEVNDPLHFSQEKQESKLKEAIEEMKRLTPTPSLENLMYTHYGTGNPQVIQPPVTSTAYMGYFTGDQCNLLGKVPEKDCVVSVTEKLKPLQTINEYIKHRGIDKIQNKEFIEELVKLSEAYKDAKIEEEKYDYAKLMTVSGIYDKDIVAKSEINILINRFLQTIPSQFRKSFFEGIDFTEATVESTKEYIQTFSEKNRLGKLKIKGNDSI